VSNYTIKIDHIEPNNPYPNSKEAYVISIPELKWTESFSLRSNASRKELEDELRFFTNRATNRILGIPNTPIEL
jgi:hypothetical protein